MIALKFMVSPFVSGDQPFLTFRIPFDKVHTFTVAMLINFSSSSGSCQFARSLSSSFLQDARIRLALFAALCITSVRFRPWNNLCSTQYSILIRKMTGKCCVTHMSGLTGTQSFTTAISVAKTWSIRDWWKSLPSGALYDSRVA